METAAECYVMAEQCERGAATVVSNRAREILLEVAAKWRALADDLKAQEAIVSPADRALGHVSHKGYASQARSADSVRRSPPAPRHDR